MNQLAADLQVQLPRLNPSLRPELDLGPELDQNPKGVTSGQVLNPGGVGSWGSELKLGSVALAALLANFVGCCLAVVVLPMKWAMSKELLGQVKQFLKNSFHVIHAQLDQKRVFHEDFLLD